MKKVLRVLLIVLLLMSNSMTVFAGSGGSGTGGGGGTGSGTVENPPSRKKTGYVFYIVDDGGNIIAEPKAATTYGDGPDGSHIFYIKTRYGGRNITSFAGSMQSITNWCQLEPFNSNGCGNGGAAKNWLISPAGEGQYNCTNFITEVWGASTAEAFIKNDNYYLIFEPVLWSSLYNGSTYVCNIVGNSIGWVNARQLVNAPLWSSNSTYPLGNLPNCFAYDIPVLGTPAPINLVGNHSYEEILSMGYGVICVWSSEIGEPPETPMPHLTHNSDAIKSWELNYIFKDFKGSRTSTLTVPPIDMNDYRKHIGEIDDEIDDYVVEESWSGSLTSFKGADVLLYRPAHGLWKVSTESKDFGKDDITYPQYSYNISRALWGDNLVICNYRGRGMESAIQSYADNKLGIKSGYVGEQTPVSAGENVDGTYGVTKSDSYSFQGVTTERWKEYVEVESDENETIDTNTETTESEPTQELKEFEEEIRSDLYEYSVTHYVDKYKAVVKDEVADTTPVETIPFERVVGRSVPRVAMITNGVGVLKVDPEIPMTMYYYESDTYYDAPNPTEVFVMGEYIRKCKPPVISYYRAGFDSGSSLRGRSYVDTALDGTAAFEWSETWGRNIDNTTYPVCAQGSGFETYSENHPVVDCVTIGLDVLDSVEGQPVKSAWKNIYSPVGAHNSFVQNLEASLESEVTLKRFNKTGGEFGEEYYMSFDISKSQVNALGSNKQNVIVEDGKVANTDELIAFIASECGVSTADATMMYNGSGIASQVEEMFISRDENASNKEGSQWYSENSIAMCLTSYKSRIIFGNIIFSDKSDYGMSEEQDAFSTAMNDNNGVQVRFFYALKHKEDSFSFDGYEFDVTGNREYLIRDSEIAGTRFLISNATTADWRR